MCGVVVSKARSNTGKSLCQPTDLSEFSQ